jgi:hypothetical protein
MHIAALSHVAYPTPQPAYPIPQPTYPMPQLTYPTPSPPTLYPNQPTLHLARLPCTSQAAYPIPPKQPTLSHPLQPGASYHRGNSPPLVREPYPPACMHIGPPPWYPRSPTLYFPTDLPYTCPRPAYPRPGHIPHTPTDLPCTSRPTYPTPAPQPVYPRPPESHTLHPSPPTLHLTTSQPARLHSHTHHPPYRPYTSQAAHPIYTHVP